MIIDIFLKALSNRLHKIGILIPHYYVVPQLFPAVKEHKCEIWLIGEGDKHVIVSETVKGHDTTVEESNALKEELCQKVIEKLLEYYGL